MKVRNLAAAVVLVAVLSFPVAAHAGDRLLPTDVLPPGRGFFQLDYDYTTIEGKIIQGALEPDITSLSHKINFRLGFGLFDGVDVEILCPYIATESFEYDYDLRPIWGVAHIKTYTEGIDDTTLNIRFLTAQEQRDGADFVFNIIGKFPSGYRKDGEPEIKIDGTIPFLQDQEAKRGYPGTGVVSYGLGFAVSGTSGTMEPYLAGTYLFGGRRERHEIDEHYADEATIILGLRAHTSPHAALDIKFTAIHKSPQTKEENRGRSREAAHWAGGVTISMQFDIAPDATFIIGVSYYLVESHKIDRDSGARIKDATGIIPNAGFHVLF